MSLFSILFCVKEKSSRFAKKQIMKVDFPLDLILKTKVSSTRRDIPDRKCSSKAIIVFRFLFISQTNERTNEYKLRKRYGFPHVIKMKLSGWDLLYD